MTFLGIDLGTTSVKAVLTTRAKTSVHLSLNEIGQTACRHEATLSGRSSSVSNSDGGAYQEQCPENILTAVASCLTTLRRDHKQSFDSITDIAVCGQMHGCLLWNSEALTTIPEDSILPKGSYSNLITWLDQRCDTDFLAGLSTISGHPVHNGFGIASIAWLQKHKQLTPTWNRCGTIQDFLVSWLCLEAVPKMTAHNACSWGFFDVASGEWKLHCLKEINFPVELLPTVVDVGTLVATVRRQFCSLPSARVYAAFGDFQCTVAPFLQSKTAVLHLGTSAQFCFEATRQNGESISTNQAGLSCFPYSKDRSLVVAASLNGGNVLDAFVALVTDWVRELTGQQIIQIEIWHRIREILSSPLPPEAAMNPLRINPRIYGERHNPTEYGSVSNITSTNLSLAALLHSLVDSLVGNLFEMLPQEVLVGNGVERVVLVGIAAEQHFAQAVRNHLQGGRGKISVSCASNQTCAAYGCCYFLAQCLSHTH